jgi:PLP dependent protein
MSDPGVAADLSSADLEARLAGVRSRIEALGVDPARVAVVAVTKGHGLSALHAALGAGLADLGENYAQELLAKDAGLGRGDRPRWHFLGRLQRNKAAKLAPLVHCYQGVSRLAEGEAILARAPAARILVEVDYTRLRQGALPEEAPGLVKELRLLGLAVDGLMTVAPAGDPDRARRVFRSLVRLAGDLELTVVSAGMSDDYEIAVAEGANMLRLGRVLFGSRPVEPYLEEWDKNGR